MLLFFYTVKWNENHLHLSDKLRSKHIKLIMQKHSKNVHKNKQSLELRANRGNGFK